MTPTASDVVSFWRDAGPSKWFRKSEEFDREIEDRFRSSVIAARNGELDDWIDDAQSILALIILLDQFPRNIFRNTPDMFASDTKAVAVAKRAMELGHDTEIDDAMRSFVYMPFMHSESPDDQDTSVALFSRPGMESNHKFALEHAEIVEKFGRFPHRNAILGRASTPAETKFLDDGGFSG